MNAERRSSYEPANRAKCGATAELLSAKQRLNQITAAEQAYHLQELVMRELTDFEEWMDNEIRKVCGKPDLEHCNQGDYAFLMAHWCLLLGYADQRNKWLERAATNERRQAKAGLEAQMREALDVIENPDSYITVICWRRFKCEPRNATAKQLWALSIDLRRAAQRRRKKGKREANKTPKWIQADLALNVEKGMVMA